MARDFRAALVDQLDPNRRGNEDTFDPSQRSNNTGISGGMAVLKESPQSQGGIPAGAEPGGFAGPALDIATGKAPGAAANAAPAADYGRLMGFGADKLNDPTKHDFKYDTGRVLSRFDPKQGFTPEVINALNSELGNTYGTYSGSGDKLSLTGAKGAKDAADFANQDWIYALKAGNDATKWNFGGGGAAPADGGASAAAPANPYGYLSPVLNGQDAGGNIESALSKFGQPNDLIQQLIAKLQGA